MSLFFFGEKRSLPRHIFITGASSGIGRALALAYASDGVRLSLSGRNEARLNETARLCRDKGATVSLFLFDVTDEVAARHAITQANTFQPLDLIIANAGISAGSFGHGESETTARAIFDTNIQGVLNTVFPALDIFKSTGGQIAINFDIPRIFFSSSRFATNNAAIAPKEVPKSILFLNLQLYFS